MPASPASASPLNPIHQVSEPVPLIAGEVCRVTRYAAATIPSRTAGTRRNTVNTAAATSRITSPGGTVAGVISPLAHRAPTAIAAASSPISCAAKKRRDQRVARESTAGATQ